MTNNLIEIELLHLLRYIKYRFDDHKHNNFYIQENIIFCDKYSILIKECFIYFTGTHETMNKLWKINNKKLYIFEQRENKWYIDKDNDLNKIYDEHVHHIFYLGHYPYQYTIYSLVVQKYIVFYC